MIRDASRRIFAIIKGVLPESFNTMNTEKNCTAKPMTAMGTDNVLPSKDTRIATIGNNQMVYWVENTLLTNRNTMRIIPVDATNTLNLDRLSRFSDILRKPMRARAMDTMMITTDTFIQYG